MAMSSGGSILSKSGGLRRAPFTFNMYHHEYKNHSDTKLFNEMPSSGNAGTVYDTHNGFDFNTALSVWSRHWLAVADAVLSYETTTFDILTYRLHAVKKSMTTSRE